MRLSRLERSLWLAGRGPFLKPDGTEGGSEGKEGEQKTDAAKAEGDDTAKDDLDGVEGLGDKGKEAIRKERAAAKAAADALKDVQKKLADLEKERDERTAAEAKAKDEEAAKKGEFEQLAAKREAERDEAKAEAATLKAENDQLRTAMAEGIAAGWKALPEAVRKIGEKQHDETDVLGRFQFLHDPDTAALVKELTEKGERKAGNGYSPKSSGDGKVSDEDKRKAQAGLYQRW